MDKRSLFLRPRFILLAIVLAVVTLGLIARIANPYHTCVAEDEANPASSAGNLDVRVGRSLGQGLRTNAGGLLVGIEVAPLQDATAPFTDIALDVMDSGGSVMGTVIAPALYPPGDAGTVPAPLQSGSVGPGYFDTAPLGIELVQGHLFRVAVRHTVVGTCDLGGSICTQGLVDEPCSIDADCEPTIRLGVSPDAYPHGQLFDHGTADPTRDLAFKTFIETSPPVDQMNLVSIGNSAGTHYESIGQSFTVGVSGPVIGIEVAPLLDSLPPDSTVQLDLLDVGTGGLLASAVRPVADFPPGSGIPTSMASCDIGPGFFEFTPPHAHVEEGQSLRFRVWHLEQLGRCDTQSNQCIEGLIGVSCALDEHCAPSFRLGNSSDTYAGGTLFADGVAYPVHDLAFKIFIAEDPAPEIPTGPWVALALVLILCGLGMLFARASARHEVER